MKPIWLIEAGVYGEEIDPPLAEIPRWKTVKCKATSARYHYMRFEGRDFTTTYRCGCISSEEPT
jgi:hypothetical protein